MTSQRPLTIAVVSAVMTSTVANAHHSYVEFDEQTTIEVEGTLVTAAWQNPHTRLTVRDSKGTDWDIETVSANGLRRTGAPLALYTVGSTVKVAGWPSKRSDSRMFGTNILSERRQELILFRATPRWGSTAFGMERAPAPSAATLSTKTLFRAWGSFVNRPGKPDDPDASGAALSRTPFPLTEAAREAAAKFDTVQYFRTMGCTPKGMPIMLYSPNPLEFVDRGDSILMRMEEYDTERIIHMSGGKDPAAQPKTRLGYSLGRWEGETLVVETSQVDDAQFLRPGVPLGPAASFVERFSLNEDGTRLHYSIVTTAPYALTEPIEQKRSWIASNEAVLPYNCTVTEGAQR